MGTLTYHNRIYGEGNTNLTLEQLSNEQREQLGNEIKRKAFAAVGREFREDRKDVPINE